MSSKKLTSKDMLKSSSTFKSHNDQIMHIIEEFDLELAALTAGIKNIFFIIQFRYKSIRKKSKRIYRLTKFTI